MTDSESDIRSYASDFEYASDGEIATTSNTGLDITTSTKHSSPTYSSDFTLDADDTPPSASQYSAVSEPSLHSSNYSSSRSFCREHDAVKTGSLVKDEDWAADVASQFTDRALVVLRKEKDENCIAKKSDVSPSLDPVTSVSYARRAQEILNRPVKTIALQDISDQSPAHHASTFTLPPPDWCYRLERLRIANILLSMDQKCCSLSEEIKRHDTYIRSNERDGMICSKEFAKCQLTKLRAHVFQQTYDDHLINNTPVMLIGSLARDLPLPTDDPEHLWTRLLSRLPAYRTPAPVQTRHMLPHRA